MTSQPLTGSIQPKVTRRRGKARGISSIDNIGALAPNVKFERAPASGTIAQIASGAATALTPDGLIKLTFSLKDKYLANANWLMKRGTVGALMLFKDNQGQYMWRPGLQAGQPSVLLGYNVRRADDMPTVGAGALPIAFGDFRAGYTVVDRLGIRTLRDPYSSKPFVEFYTRQRVGGDVVDFEAYALQVISA